MFLHYDVNPLYSETGALVNLDKPPANPYAPPQAPVTAATGHACWRDGKVVVVPAGASLPERCIKCNAPALMDKPRSFTWHSPGWYLLLFVAIIVYVVVAMVVRRKVKLAVGLCDVHRKRRRNLTMSALGALLLGGGAFVGAIKLDNGLFGALAVAALLAAVILALLASGTLSPARIDDSEARFKGCGKAFLDSLPDR